MKQILKKLFAHNESDSFKTKVKRGAFWTVGITVWTRILGIIASIIITRQLSPEDFGLMAIASSIVAITTGITATGFNTAIIQKQINPDILLDSAWTMELMKGLTLSIIIYITAPYVANYFSDLRLIPMLRILGLTFAIKGVENVGVIWFRKNLDLKKEFIFNAIPESIYFILVITLAFSLKSVWALIIATVLGVIIKTVLSYFIHPYRPKVEINYEHFKELLAFGKWILGGSIAVMLRNHGISLFIARYYNTGILGSYNRGEVFSRKIFDEITRTLWKVGFPAFSMLSRDIPRFRKIFLTTLKMITVLGFPMTIGLFVLSSEITVFVLTEKWISIVPLLQLFSLSAITGFIQTPVGISFQSMGKPAINTKLALINMILLLVLIYPISIKYGVQGIILASIISNLVIFPIGWVNISNSLKIGFKEFVLSFLPQLLYSVLMGAIIYQLKASLYRINSLSDLIIYILIGVLIYTIILLVSDRYLKTNYRDTMFILLR